MREYPKQSWVDPRIEVGRSSKGLGMFTKELIKKGEIVTIWGGNVFTNEEKKAGLVKKHTGNQIDENHWLGSHLNEHDAPDQRLNHSCDPNIWLIDEITLAARRDVSTGEEITADYSTWIVDKDWVMDEPCRCGSSLCRHTITGNDWQLEELQQRYEGHFAPFINERIKKLTSQWSSKANT